MRFFIPGPLPGLNEIIEASKGAGGLGRVYAKMKRQWTNHVAFHVVAARVTVANRVRLELEWVEPVHANKAERDPDNIEAGQKFIWDGLKAAKRIPDDKRTNNAGTMHTHSAGPKAGVWVTVIPT
jgi:hypothetical protein